MAGEMAGLKVLDLACGEGHYSRMIKARGAAHVLGVDASAGMIALAREEEHRAPLGIEYAVADVRKLSDLGAFDLVVAAYLLNYARDVRELEDYCRSVARTLMTGAGRFVAMNASPWLNELPDRSYLEYGFKLVMRPGLLMEGQSYRWEFDLGGERVEVENYFLGPGAHEKAFRSAGFREFHWRPLCISPEGQAAYPTGLWDRFLQDPPIVAIEALR